MSIQVMSRVWAHSKQEGGSLLVLLALADNANEDGIAWPSVKKLALKARLSERQVQRVLSGLIKDGELKLVKATTNRQGSTNVYRVLMGDNLSGVGVTPDGGTGDIPTGGTGDAHVTQSVRNRHNEPSGATATPSRFSKPNLEECRAEASRLGIDPIEGDNFFDRNEAGGWRVGRGPMKDWKAAMRTWARNAVRFAGLQALRESAGSRYPVQPAKAAPVAAQAHWRTELGLVLKALQTVEADHLSFPLVRRIRFAAEFAADEKSDWRAAAAELLAKLPLETHEKTRVAFNRHAEGIE